MDITVAVLDPAVDAPCAALADRFITGPLTDADAIAQLVEASRVTTYEIEHIDVASLRRLNEAGHHILPSPDVLAVVQDKLVQRELFAHAGLPGPRFVAFDPEDHSCLTRFGLPAVQKVRRGGYDGRGVAILRDAEQERIPGPSLLEELVDIRTELAVLVVRGIDGTTVSYDPVEMVFDPAANICTHVLAPAEIDAAMTREAVRVAEAAVEALGGVGVHGVELFLDSRDRILVNEIAPRPHNSGHYTIEACVTSQFEQHLRAVLGLPLGSCETLAAAAMINLLGAHGYRGATVVEGLERALALSGVSLHLYGKRTCVAGRKMGHITAVAADPTVAVERAQAAAAALIVRGEDRVERTVEA